MEGLIFGILRYLNEDMTVAVVIAIKAIANKPEKKKIRDFKGIRTHGLYVSAAVLYHLSYEDPYIGSRPIPFTG